MYFNYNYKVVTKPINVKIPIEASYDMKQFIFKHINMYRRIKNDFIEKANEHFDKYGTYKGFSAKKYKAIYFKMEQEMGRYSEYTRGLSNSVALEMDGNINMILSKHEKTGTIGKFHFRRFDRLKGSFRVDIKPGEYKVGLETHYSSRIESVPFDQLIKFVVRGKKFGDEKQVLWISLKEPLYEDTIYHKHGNDVFIRTFDERGEKSVHEYRFTRHDIKFISFIHELGNFYIQLNISATYFINKDMISERVEKAGIDTGIHNPAVIYDGKHYIRVAMDDKTLKKIHYQEDKAKYLQSIMDRKMKINMKRKKSGEIKSVYTKNYEKVRRKFRIAHKRIVNIKRDWRYKTAKLIVTTYKQIVVDRFEMPNATDEDFPEDVKKHINSNNRFYGMYDFNEILYHMAEKYGCIYIKAPENTTRTCSICGKKNKHLPLTNRYLRCVKCGSKIDRDMNAAKNCYDY